MIAVPLWLAIALASALVLLLLTSFVAVVSWFGIAKMYRELEASKKLLQIDLVDRRSATARIDRGTTINQTGRPA